MRCRLCGCEDLPSVIGFGKMPLANAFLSSPNEPEELFDLEVVFCPVCSLLQLAHTVPPEKLFSNYNYFSSVSQSMIHHVEDLADELIQDRHLNNHSLVTELASNDGYALKYFLEQGIEVLGIDPAKNVAQVARDKGVPTLVAFFDEAMSHQLPKSDVVMALNVLGHVPNPLDFALGIKNILKPDGVCVIEVPSARDMIDSVSPDQIYFEHIFYWSLSSLSYLFMKAGLTISRAEKIDIHGGGYRLYVTQMNPFAYDRPTNTLRQIENNMGVDQYPYYQCFATRVRDSLEKLLDLLKEIKSQGKQIVAYGAAAKGTQLLNYLGVGMETINYVVDATPTKINKYVPGCRIPVVSPDKFGRVDYCLLTARNWSGEIKSKHPDYGGRWIVPLPYPTIE